MRVLGELKPINESTERTFSTRAEDYGLSKPVNQSQPISKKQELEERYTAARNKIDQEELANQRIEEQRARLQMACELAEDALMNSASRKVYFEQRIKELLTQSVQSWGHAEPDFSIQNPSSPITVIANCHATINALRSALQQYPDVQRVLTERLNQAKAALAQFQKNAPK